MKFRKFKQNKLWGDKAIDLMEAQGSKIHWTALNDYEFFAQLKIKFMEEAQEVWNANTKEALIEELSDIMEVISSLCLVHEFSMEDIAKMQRKKYEERGGFEGKKFVTVAEHTPGSWGEKYCLADPEKYPEVIE